MPGGPFTMGTSSQAWALDNERPAHTVLLAPFYLDTVPVTNAAYLEFVADGQREAATVVTVVITLITTVMAILVRTLGLNVGLRSSR